MTRVLLVEDNAGDRRLVAELLRDVREMSLDACESLTRALEHLASSSYDCALLDLSLADADGLEAVEQLRVAAPSLPLVVLTGNRDERLALRAMQVGAQDFLIKGDIDAPGLTRSVRYAIERERSELHLRRMALHDPLTGLPNRRLFSDRLDQALARRDRTGGTIAVLFGDLDGFKAVNDTHGHDAGDELLRQLAGRLQLAVRGTDTVARLGGDEFTILCEQVSAERDAAIIADRVADAVSAPFKLEAGEAHVSMSVGIACANGAGAVASELVRAADEAMYRRKSERTRSGARRTSGLAGGPDGDALR